MTTNPKLGDKDTRASTPDAARRDEHIPAGNPAPDGQSGTEAEGGSGATKRAPPPLGYVEPHAGLLRAPPPGQKLYKIIKVDHFLRSIVESYLHFRRVDTYKDFPGADSNDGQQLPLDAAGNSIAKFEKAPEFSVADYYDRSRVRTYACCFSLENSQHIWSSYGNGSSHGKVCLEIDFSKLRDRLNATLQSGTAALIYDGNKCAQIFSINYGVVEYVDWSKHRLNEQYLPNPIQYAYVKDRLNYGDEKELRISLSATGMGHFELADGRTIDFPPDLRLGFDFRSAMADSTISILCDPVQCDQAFLRAELDKLRIRCSDDVP